MTTSTCVLMDTVAPLKTLQEITAKLAGADGELGLDFSAIDHIDAETLRALDELALAAERAKVAIAFRGVNVKVYKVFKLAGLTSLFSFVG